MEKNKFLNSFISPCCIHMTFLLLFVFLRLICLVNSVVRYTCSRVGQKTILFLFLSKSLMTEVSIYSIDCQNMPLCLGFLIIMMGRVSFRNLLISHAFYYFNLK